MDNGAEVGSRFDPEKLQGKVTSFVQVILLHDLIRKSLRIRTIGTGMC
jgi:hypothetical protein